MDNDLKFLVSFGITLDEIVFLSCIDLRKRLMETNLTLKEVQRIKKIRKRERSKALEERELQELEDSIVSLSDIKDKLSEQKSQLHREVELYKIRTFLASPPKI
ncbi:hypothetical protein LOD99_11587 [Oopsacas minuta]|uniref:Uncharacterized protein n=1 Tax=Oopsacas minuta TaxID=111878 RepID=A0AAV7JLI1_9METZ|nr:hypothetical protein LOD99_11587 [Oopsacas minuta]